MKKGFSLIETLVVVGLFALIGIVVSQSTAITLTGSRKADASAKVRENLTQTMGLIERQLRSARSITSACNNSSRQSISYTDADGTPASFSCNPNSTCHSSSSTYVSSTSPVSTNRVTSTDTLCITSCQFICRPNASGTPPSIDVILEGKSKEATGVEDTSIRVQTKINLRAY